MQNQSKFMRYANYTMLILFFLGFILQFNDPDALPWMIVYASALLCRLLFSLQKLPWVLATVVAVTALSWSLFLLPDVIGHVGASDIFALTMKTESIEKAREMGGLLLITVWMAILSWRVYRHQKAV